MFFMALMMSFSVMNAQVATENSKVFDNVFASVNAGVATPLTFDGVFPVNTMAGIAVGKWFTPVVGAEVEGTVWFNDRGFYTGNLNRPFVKGHYVGVNGLVNLSNLFFGYKGAPRMFEVNAVLGTGWLHEYIKGDDNDLNSLGVKTGLDFAFNLGKSKAHTVSVRPAVLWDVNHPHTMMVESFCKNSAQLYLGIGYTYHFKTSNGTRHFRTYNVGAMMEEINSLQAKLNEKPTETVVREVPVEVVREVPVEVVREVNVSDTYVFFAFDSAELDEHAKAELDKVGENGVYNVVAYASSEGSTAYNKALSQRRADAVRDYLVARGCRVNSAEGRGVLFGTTTGRVAVVSAK